MTRYRLRALAIGVLLSLPLQAIPLQATAQALEALTYRSVGPTRGGRVTAVAGTVQAPGTFYLGASGGGVWKSSDYGQSWRNVSDGYFSTPSIGAISVSQTDPNILYVGTGSDGLRSNVIAGRGMYRSSDGGASWDAIGLQRVGQIGAVEIDPRNNNVVWVAAIGQPFNANPERGVYRSGDGGESWERVLKVSEQVGFADLELLPANPDVVLAAAWKAERKPWTIISGGSAQEGGLYKSRDGGRHWRRISQGLPDALIGKIDLAVSRADSSVVYALVEAPGEQGGLYRSDDQGESFRQVSREKGLRTRPFYYTNVEADPFDADTVYVMATDYLRSTDGGQTWEKLQPPHADSHDMWINPDNPRLFIQANDGGANVTHNGGATWSTQFNQPTAELYQVEVDDQYPYWLYGGQQDNYSTIAVPARLPYGVQSTDALLLETGGCETGPAVPKPGAADTVFVNCKGRFGVFDKRTGTERRYYVGAANRYGQNPRELRYRFQRVAPIQVSPHDPDTVYHASQYVHRTRDQGITWETISPDLTAFEADKQVISGGPITRDITGEEVYSAIYALRESALEPGVIWSGANDGPIYVTRNGGEDWQEVTPRGLPRGGRVDSVEPSRHVAGVAYVSVLRYQLGDPTPYIYRAENYGRRWRLLSVDNGIPGDFPVRVVREDPQKPGLLYAGTEYGVFVSFDDGGQWQSLQHNLPVTPVTDIKIHRDDLVLSTMGRGFWVLDKGPATLRQDPLAGPDEQPRLFAPAATIRYRQTLRARGEHTVPHYPTPAVMIDYRLPAQPPATLTLEILDDQGAVLHAYRRRAEEEPAEPPPQDDMALNTVTPVGEKTLSAPPGMNRFAWDMRSQGAWHKEARRRYRRGPLAPPGTYRARLTAGDAVLEQRFELRVDPRVAASGVSVADIRAQFALQRQAQDLLSQARRLAHELEQQRQELEQQRQEPDNNSARARLIDEVRGELVTQQGHYMPPKLIDQVHYLYRMLDNADQAPGQEARERLAALQAAFAALSARL